MWLQSHKQMGELGSVWTPHHQWVTKWKQTHHQWAGECVAIALARGSQRKGGGGGALANHELPNQEVLDRHPLFYIRLFE
jgi:hypothetical protein